MVGSVQTLHVIAASAAHAAVAAAIEAAAAAQCAVAAAVVDASGELVAFLRSTGAPFHSSAIARDKAYTAASFKVPTSEMYQMVSGNTALREGITRRDRLVLFGGGLPIVFGDRLVGGIGVSGGSEELDTACANAGLVAIEAKPF